jgi:hypothetical protein
MRVNIYNCLIILRDLLFHNKYRLVGLVLVRLIKFDNFFMITSNKERKQWRLLT